MDMLNASILIPFLIKYFVISGYDPTSDGIDKVFELLSPSVIKVLNEHSESVNAQLKKEGYSKEQIKDIKEVLARSDARYLTSSATAIYEHHADAMEISRHIFAAYREGQETGTASTQTGRRFTDDAENEEIIKGISFIVQRTVNLCLTSPEYTEWLTRKQNETDIIVKKLQEMIGYLESLFMTFVNSGTQKTDDIEQRIQEYYAHIMGLYTKRSIGNDLLGEESLSELYMQPSYYRSKDETGDVEKLLEAFIADGDSGVLWIVGEPGHGKTSMCIKAVADYVNKKRYQLAGGVFWFRLNPQGIASLVDEQGFVLENVFCWGYGEGKRKYMIEPDEIRGSLVFLDGFDELKSFLEAKRITDNQFHSQVNQIAESYHLHIVVTSRTQALRKEKSCTEERLKEGNGGIHCELRDGGTRKNSVKLLAPLADVKQLEWIDGLIKCRKDRNEDVSELEGYRSGFPSLQENDDVSGLLEVPILLRMIVQNCFEPSSDNRVELYNDLFRKTLIRQGLDNLIDDLKKVYEEIAFRIFVYDDDSAEISIDEFAELEVSDAYLYQYYLHTPESEGGSGAKDKYRVTFLHRSFYQHFLSEFLYEKLCNVNNIESGETFLRYLWARRLDSYVLENVRYRAKGEGIEYKFLLEAIDNTDGFLNEYAHASDSGEPVGNFDKANNTFWNAVSLSNSVFLKERNPKEFILPKRTIELLIKYDCCGMFLNYSVLYNVDLRYIKLGFAQLICARLICSKLRYADLRNADLSNTELSRADLRHADLSAANLSNAKLMCKTDLSFANLGYSILKGALLSDTDLFNADVQYTKVTKEQYDYIAKQDVRNLDKIIIVDDE